ncbi:hypothetical protein TIFTF001_045800 [Ficus carica]|uniref:Uncharacterized protein n=1 Tax=Ficus carica TaxID=3494 RepID=A0AA88CML4_FICCA|nr:hypothetical protein TIFTF001_045786 [Ficus carica]GMN23575.1 hypothetical protein TIFTF001_045792 [Ficus carica]GMN23614.1 hypothetical protein TIFTF001_045794 [Ficus carica]GMN23630.1 hypothetical protein TIFTF001_045800 [Ficus carica]
MQHEIHTRLTEFEPVDEYTGEGVGLGQDLMGIREDLRTRKELPAHLQMVRNGFEFRGKSKTDTTTWAPVERKTKEMNSRGGTRKKKPQKLLKFHSLQQYTTLSLPTTFPFFQVFTFLIVLFFFLFFFFFLQPNSIGLRRAFLESWIAVEVEVEDEDEDEDEEANEAIRAVQVDDNLWAPAFNFTLVLIL